MSIPNNTAKEMDVPITKDIGNITTYFLHTVDHYLGHLS